jgi:hypothetical protein
MSALETGEIRVDVVQELRELVERGADVPELVEHLQHRLGLDVDASLLVTILYFRTAFCITLREALPLREWLAGKDRSEVDSILIPAIQRTKAQWHTTHVPTVVAST